MNKDLVVEAHNGAPEARPKQQWTIGKVYRSFSYWWSSAILIFAIAVLYYGAQCAIVGLSSVNIETFKETHPHAYKTCKWLHSGANLERFIVGRQFLLLFIIFVMSKFFSHNNGKMIASQQQEEEAERMHGGIYIDQANTTEFTFYMGGWEWGTSAVTALLQNQILLMVVIIVP
eukprot:gene23669-24127_t